MAPSDHPGAELETELSPSAPFWWMLCSASDLVCQPPKRLLCCPDQQALFPGMLAFQGRPKREALQHFGVFQQPGPRDLHHDQAMLTRSAIPGWGCRGRWKWLHFLFLHCCLHPSLG